MTETRYGAGRRSDILRIHAGVWCLAIAALCGVRAHAAETAAPLSEEVFFDELPIVLTVTRLAQPKSETPAAVTVIDRDLIRASGARTIADLFWLVPGFQVGYDHAPRPTVTYHGLSDEFARRMQVLVDGRSVYNALFGGVFWIDLPLALDDIERIEVIRGPNAAAYGSNAFLGVINITTRHAARDPGTHVKLAAGEHRIRDGMVRHGWNSERGAARVTLAYRQDDGFDGLPDTVRVPLMTYRGDYRLGARDTLELQAGINGETHGEGHTGHPTDGPRDSEMTSHFQLLRWRRAFAPSNELAVQFYHNYWKNQEAYLTAPLDLGPLGINRVPVNFNAKEERYDVEVQHIVSAARDWRYVWGAGARLDRANSATGFATEETIQNRVHRAFGNAEWRPGQDTTVNAGAMWEKDGISGTDFLPRIALNRHLSPRHTLRLAASRATRTPALVEEKGDVRFTLQGVPLDQSIAAGGGLDAEVMKSYELGYLGQWADRNLTVDVRVFRDRMHDLITEVSAPAADTDGEATDFRNEGQADVTGAEAQLDYRWTPATRFVLNYARMRADVSGVSAQAEFSEEERERSVPAYSASLFALHRFSRRWEGSAVYHRVADMEWLGVGGPVDGYDRLDVRLARAVKIGRAAGQVALVIQNVGGDTTPFHPENVFDRRAFVTLTLRR